jgi:pSer/pThr/pTyr-binding forkhead associated (FHA) protein
MPKILVSLPDGISVTHDLNESTITLGRISENTLQIEDVSVSSRHAQLTLGDNGDYVLQDLGSTNGTWVNSKEAHEGQDHLLQDGDKLRFGNIDASYVSENPADARPMPESEGVAVVAASSSKRPADFANASPFQTRKKKRDPIGIAIIAFAIVALLAFGGAVAYSLTLKSPFQ